MRARTLLLSALAASLAGCAMHAPEPPDKPASYNRRELPPQQGLFSGPDGVFTVYQSGEAAAPPGAPPPPEPAAPPKRREVLMCDRPEGCETPPEPD
jgi:hypothetical protein